MRRARSAVIRRDHFNLSTGTATRVEVSADGFGSHEKKFSSHCHPIGRPLPGTANSLTSFLRECALARNLQDLGKETTTYFSHTMAFSLERYWKLKETERLAPAARYEEELLWANWNPEVPSLLQAGCPTELEPADKQSKGDGRR